MIGAGIRAHRDGHRSRAVPARAAPRGARRWRSLAAAADKPGRADRGRARRDGLHDRTLADARPRALVSRLPASLGEAAIAVSILVAGPRVPADSSDGKRSRQAVRGSSTARIRSDARRTRRQPGADHVDASSASTPASSSAQLVLLALVLPWLLVQRRRGLRSRAGHGGRSSPVRWPADGSSSARRRSRIRSRGRWRGSRCIRCSSVPPRGRDGLGQTHDERRLDGRRSPCRRPPAVSHWMIGFFAVNGARTRSWE